MNGELQARISVSVDERMRNEIHAYCSKTHLKQAELFRRALNEYLRNHPIKYDHKVDPETPL